MYIALTAVVFLALSILAVTSSHQELQMELVALREAEQLSGTMGKRTTVKLQIANICININLITNDFNKVEKQNSN